MFDRRRGTKHAPQALAFFIEQDRPPRVVVANLDSAPSVFFHTNLLVGQIFAKHTYAVSSPSGLKSWPMPADLMGGRVVSLPTIPLSKEITAFSFNAKLRQSVCPWHQTAMPGQADVICS